MLFSAIAMVAFTLSANAANEAVESIDVITTDFPCSDSWSVDYNYYIAIGWSHEDAVKRSNENFNKCLDTFYPKVDEPKDSPTKGTGTEKPVGIFR